MGGLHIHSEIPLPELAPQHSTEADIRISLGAVPDTLPDPQWEEHGVQVQGDTALLDIPDIASYLIERGSSIRIAPASNAEMVDIRLFLLGTAFGIACHQNGTFPLHASAIMVENQVIAFVGPSGAGKSTLGTWLTQAGYPLLTDDVCILKQSQNTAPTAHSGSPRIKLWLDALQALEIDHRALQRDMTRTDKFHLTLNQAHNATAAAPLRAIYLLNTEDAAECTIEGPRDHLNAIAVISDNTYRQELIEAMGRSRQHFAACAQIGRHVPVYKLRRPRSLKAMTTVIEALEQHWSQHIHPEQPHAANY